MEALQRVTQTYRDPYTVITNGRQGAATYALAAARELGMDTEEYPFDPTKCGSDCAITNHRRTGGPTGSWCPTAESRNLDLMIKTGVDVVLAFHRPESSVAEVRDGTKQIKKQGIAVWDYVQQRSARRSE